MHQAAHWRGGAETAGVPVSPSNPVMDRCRDGVVSQQISSGHMRHQGGSKQLKMVIWAELLPWGKPENNIDASVVAEEGF